MWALIINQNAVKIAEKKYKTKPMNMKMLKDGCQHLYETKEEAEAALELLEESQDLVALIEQDRARYGDYLVKVRRLRDRNKKLAAEEGREYKPNMITQVVDRLDTLQAQKQDAESLKKVIRQKIYERELHEARLKDAINQGADKEAEAARTGSAEAERAASEALAALVRTHAMTLDGMQHFFSKVEEEAKAEAEKQVRQPKQEPAQEGLKKIQALEAACLERSEQELAKDGLTNIIDAYAAARQNGNKDIDFDMVIWSKDVEKMAENLRAYGIARFTISTCMSRLLEVLGMFEDNGYKVEGIVTVKDRYTDFITGEYRLKKAVLLEAKKEGNNVQEEAEENEEAAERPEEPERPKPIAFTKKERELLRDIEYDMVEAVTTEEPGSNTTYVNISFDRRKTRFFESILRKVGSEVMEIVEEAEAYSDDRWLSYNMKVSVDFWVEYYEA